MPRTTYIIQDTTKSRCPECNNPVDLLCPERELKIYKPMFYICWTCLAVYEVGHGEIRREK